MSPTELVEAIEQGLRDFAAGQITLPARQHTHRGEVTLLTMPILGQQAFGAKIVSVVPSNAARNLPVIQGLMTLYDGVSGKPVAVLDAATLTAQRTGAVGAVGLKYTTPTDVESVGIIGPGVQGTWQAIFACAVRPIQTIYFVARSDEKAERFVEFVFHRIPSAVRILRCKDANELLAKTQVVFAATSSVTPVLPDDRERLRGKHFISVGSYKPNMQELPHAIYELAREVVIDSDAAKQEVGDLIFPLSSGLINLENVIHLADLVTGKRAVDPARTTVFKSVGLALYDLYAAQAFCVEAEQSNRGTMVDL